MEVIRTNSEALAPRTTEVGRAILSADLERLEQKLSEYRFSLASTQSDLEASQATWMNFQLACDKFSDWLDTTTQTIQESMELQADMKEKETYLNKFMV